MQGQFRLKLFKTNFLKFKNNMQGQFDPKILKSKSLTTETICMSSLVQKC